MFAVAKDFDRLPYNLTNLDKLSAGVFDDFVSYNEEKHLRELLGSLFYDALATAYAALPQVYVPATAYAINDLVVFVANNVADIYINIQAGTGKTPSTNPLYWTKQPVNRWVRLIYGDMYTYYQRPQKWYGMKRLVVPLIYALRTAFEYDNQGSNGISVANKENSTVVSPATRITRALNEYANLCAGDFPNVIDWSYMIWPELENSLFGYLYLTSDTWNDLVVDQPGGDFKAYLAYSFVYPGLTNVYGL